MGKAGGMSLVGGALLAAALGVSATDAPVIGAVHNTKDNGWLSYECGGVDNDRLTCTMTQVAIRRTLEPAEVEAKYQEAVKGWPDSLAKEMKTTPAKLMDGKDMRELCTTASAYVGLVRGTGDGSGLEPDVIAHVRSQSAIEGRDIEQQFAAILDGCTSGNLDGLKRSTRLSLERDSRTCKVSTNRFEQTFRSVRDANGKLLSWAVADTTPQGDCGFVQMSRFLPADVNGTPSTVFWQYVGKRATANPESKTAWGGSCKDWDERETLYDWKPQAIVLQCDYIEYSPI